MNNSIKSNFNNRELFKKKAISRAIGLCVLTGSMFPSLASANMQDRIEALEAQLNVLKAQVSEQKTLTESAIEKSNNTQSNNNSVSVKTASGTTFEYGGFIKLDSVWAEGDHGKISNNYLIVPSSIGTDETLGSTKSRLNATAKFSRFHFKTSTVTDAGKIGSYIELDFNGGDGSGVTNQGSSGLRHAFFTWDYNDNSSLLAGQTWSTLFNTAALPEAADFVGPTAGTVFIRQPQVRWTHKLSRGSVMLALEEPGSTTGGKATEIDGGGAMPDVIARYNGKAGNFSYSLAGVLREIVVSESDFTDNQSENGFGVSLSGVYRFDSGDNLKMMYNHGELGRYVALAAFNDGAYDSAAGDIDVRTTSGGFVSYQHHWSDQLRSSVTYAFTQNNDEEIAGAAKEISNAYINLMYSPTKKLTLGAEYMMGEREEVNGNSGEETRLQVTAKYGF